MSDTPLSADPKPNAPEADARRDAIIGWAIIGVLAAAALIAVTTIGFGPYEATTGGARPPTLWDWLGLLIVPLAVAAGAGFIGYVQKRTELDIAKKAREEDGEIARQARESEQQIAADRLRQASLEGYYDRMTELLLEHGLRESAEDSEARSIARARTVAVVKGLDGERKGQLLAFLQASRLIGKEKPIIYLRRIDFDGIALPQAYLSRVDLYEVNLSGANLREADLSKAYLGMANLSGADLRRANLYSANLSKADLSKAYLGMANLIWADLSEADLSEANLDGISLGEANLSGANLSRADLSRALLSGANLSSANLSWANLRKANLSWANMLWADLQGTDLRGANLYSANLNGAVGWTMQQFDQCRSPHDTTMPYGVKLQDNDNLISPGYDDWSLNDTTMPDGVRLQGDENPDGPTYDEWKAAYLAKQQSFSQPNDA